MNTQQFLGPSSRRIDMLAQGQSGGGAGKGVSRDVIVGNIGLNVENSPIVAHDDEGRAVQFPSNDGTYRPAHFERVHSYRRDPDVYADPFTFRLKFSKPLFKVFAIEMVELNLPNVDATAPAHREVMILNGLLKTNDGGSTYSFHPQDSLKGENTFNTMVTHNAGDPYVSRTAASETAVDHFHFDDSAFGAFPYDSNNAAQQFRRNGWHNKLWFPSTIPRLDYLDFAVVDSVGDPYDFPTNSEWSATLQIISKQ